MKLLDNKHQITVNARIAKYALVKLIGAATRAYMARPFTKRNGRRVCIYYEPHRISFSQVYPFIYYQNEISNRYDVEIRCIPVHNLLNGRPPKHRNSDVILLQTWFTIDQRSLYRALTLLAENSPSAKISFLDSFAHNDIRLAQTLDPFITFYIKKTLFLDRNKYLDVCRGGTNLTEYYECLYQIFSDSIDWKVPMSVLKKLRIGPNFFTAPHFIADLADEDVPILAPRKIDIHARIGVSGNGWYQIMRASSLERLESLSNLNISTGIGISWKQYMTEMRNSKICFSPFGYGELCWRDVEAFVTGAALIKPDMSHLETLPKLYIADETYFAIKWDFSDLPEVVNRVLSNDDLRKRVVTEAYRRVSDYVRRAQFVDDMSFLFEAKTESENTMNKK